MECEVILLEECSEPAWQIRMQGPEAIETAEEADSNNAMHISSSVNLLR
jgi:hypothetical protein